MGEPDERNTPIGIKKADSFSETEVSLPLLSPPALHPMKGISDSPVQMAVIPIVHIPFQLSEPCPHAFYIDDGIETVCCRATVFIGRAVFI